MRAFQKPSQDKQKMEEQLLNEIEVLSRLSRPLIQCWRQNEIIVYGNRYRHPNVVAILGVSWDEHRPVVVYEYMSNLSLYDVLHVVH